MYVAEDEAENEESRIISKDEIITYKNWELLRFFYAVVKQKWNVYAFTLSSNYWYL